MGITAIFNGGFGILLLTFVIILGVIFFYLVWHLFFMIFLPAKRVALRDVPQEDLSYKPYLGFTLADGGEKIEKKEEEKHE